MKGTIALFAFCVVAVVNAQEFTSQTAQLAKKNYENTVAKARKEYVERLRGALSMATMQKNTAEANMIQETITTLTGETGQDGARSPDPKNVKTVKVPANKATGWVLGKVSKGDKITIQYVSGMWSHFWANPVLTSPDASDNVACQIQVKMGGQYGILVKVPTNTKEHPFEYAFDNDYESVILKCPWGPESVGEAVYKIAVTKAR